MSSTCSTSRTPIQLRSWLLKSELLKLSIDPRYYDTITLAIMGSYTMLLGQLLQILSASQAAHRYNAHIAEHKHRCYARYLYNLRSWRSRSRNSRSIRDSMRFLMSAGAGKKRADNCRVTCSDKSSIRVWFWQALPVQQSLTAVNI